MTLTPAFLDEVRARTTLSTLIARSVKLTRAGNEWKACCPFHQEKSPSFYVNDQKGFYHCFGCGAHGDAIRWLTEQAGLGFMDAVKDLADAGGLEMPAPDPALARRIEAQAGLHDVMQAAADWYRAQYAEHRPARDYAAKRGLSQATVDAFGIGYAPDGRTRLKDALKAFDERLLVEAGLLIAVDNKPPYDRFRDRLMIPIRDPRGRVIAFGGRTLGEGEPKYLNSPETPLFDKGRTLFNLDKAAPAARKAGRLIVVEGYLDVVGLAQAELREGVAPLGTALTEMQMERLWTVVDRPVLCFDGDNAGRQATIRSAARAMPILRVGKSLSFASLPEGADPFDMAISEGRPRIDAVIAEAQSLVSVLYNHERSLIDPVSPDERANLRGKLSGYASSCTDRLVSDEYNRSFNQIFYEEFGWGRDHRKAIGKSVLTTGPTARRDLYRLYARSALYGLTRFPEVLINNMETFSLIDFKYDELKVYQEVIWEAANDRPQIGHNRIDGVTEILDASWAVKIRPSITYDLQSDLRFPYSERGVDRSHATPYLSAMVRLLREERDLDDRLRELDERAVADTGLGNYDWIEAQRKPLRARLKALYENAVMLGDNDAMGGFNMTGSDS